MATLPAHAGTMKGVEINPIAEYDSKGTRLTCVTLADGEDVGPPVNGKRKRGEEGLSASEEDAGSSDGAWEDDDDVENGAGDESGEEPEDYESGED